MDTENTNRNTTELTRVPQQARSLEKFDAILAAALRLIHQRGYEQVSMREIARDVGLPIASVYQYFPNKLAIVRQLWESYTSALGELLGSELESGVVAPDEAGAPGDQGAEYVRVGERRWQAHRAVLGQDHHLLHADYQVHIDWRFFPGHGSGIGAAGYECESDCHYQAFVYG